MSTIQTTLPFVIPCFFNDIVRGCGLSHRRGDSCLLMSLLLATNPSQCVALADRSNVAELSPTDSTWECRSRSPQHAILRAYFEHATLPRSVHRHEDGLQTLEAARHDSPVRHVLRGRVECARPCFVCGPMLL